MKRYVALLRGINLGTRNRVSMAKLREVCEKVGATNVRTLIASGNVVLDSDLIAGALRRRLELDFEREFGFGVLFVVLSAAEMKDVVEHNPFADAGPKTVHVAFAAESIDGSTKQKLEALDAGDERAVVRGRWIYMYLPRGFEGVNLLGMGSSKMKPPVTIRGWPTVLKLRDMAAS